MKLCLTRTCFDFKNTYLFFVYSTPGKGSSILVSVYWIIYREYLAIAGLLNWVRSLLMISLLEDFAHYHIRTNNLVWTALQLPRRPKKRNLIHKSYKINKINAMVPIPLLFGGFDWLNETKMNNKAEHIFVHVCINIFVAYTFGPQCLPTTSPFTDLYMDQPV